MDNEQFTKEEIQMAHERGLLAIYLTPLASLISGNANLKLQNIHKTGKLKKLVKDFEKSEFL